MSQTIRIPQINEAAAAPISEPVETTAKNQCCRHVADGSFVDRSRPGSGLAKALNDWTG